MTKEVLEMIKETVKEIEEEKKQEETEINRIYEEIWKDILTLYKININQTEIMIQLNDYIDPEETPEKIENKVIETLYKDGFRCDKTGPYPAYVISIKKIIEFAKKENESNNTEINTKNLITPFAETRRKK